MARARTGTLVYKRTTGWNAKVWVTVRDEKGETQDERRWVPLGTHDKDLARRKMGSIVAGVANGEIVADAIRVEAARVPTVVDAIRDYCKRRKAAGVAMADTELGYAEHHIIRPTSAIATRRTGFDSMISSTSSDLKKRERSRRR